MKAFYAFGKPVPPEAIELLLSEGFTIEELTTDFLETLYEYDYRDDPNID